MTKRAHPQQALCVSCYLVNFLLTISLNSDWNGNSRNIPAPKFVPFCSCSSLSSRRIIATNSASQPFFFFNRQNSAGKKNMILCFCATANFSTFQLVTHVPLPATTSTSRLELVYISVSYTHLTLPTTPYV